MSKSESGRSERPNDQRSTAYEYTRPSHVKGRGGNVVCADAVNQVYRELADVDGVEYRYSKRIADGSDLSRTRVGMAMAALAADPDCPLDVERWSGENTTPAVWRVERRAVADGGLDVTHWVLEQVRALADPWVPAAALLEAAQQSPHTIADADVKQALDTLDDADDILIWQGDVAPTDDATLTAICEAERERDIPRNELVATVNNIRHRQDAPVADGGAPVDDGIELTATGWKVSVTEKRSLGDYENVSPHASLEGEFGDGVVLDSEQREAVREELEYTQEILRDVVKQSADRRTRSRGADQ